MAHSSPEMTKGIREYVLLIPGDESVTTMPGFSRELKTIQVVKDKKIVMKLQVARGRNNVRKILVRFIFKFN